MTKLQTRNKPQEDLQTRKVALALPKGGPATLDEETRSVEVVAATEQPVEVYDWNRGLVREVLLMAALEGPPEQVPLLDAHSRFATNDLLGSARGFRIEGDKLITRAHRIPRP
ncbi:MAG: hypothetical protein JRJ59_06385 [Deltaproteobacteria bacterium]|nr:hypothetical protein [Deltaproteobacteria bacterium]